MKQLPALERQSKCVAERQKLMNGENDIQRRVNKSPAYLESDLFTLFSFTFLLTVRHVFSIPIMHLFFPIFYLDLPSTLTTTWQAVRSKVREKGLSPIPVYCVCSCTMWLHTTSASACTLNSILFPLAPKNSFHTWHTPPLQQVPSIISLHHLYKNLS